MVKTFFGACVVLAAALSLHADPVDPVWSLGDPDQGTPIFSTKFQFQDDDLGGGIFSFINESGVTWTSLDFLVTLPSLSTFACGPGPFFTFCQISPESIMGDTTKYDIAPVGPGSTGGIANGVFFTINLNDFISPGVQNPDPNGAGGWVPNNSFAGTANLNTTPEPSTLALYTTGAALLAWGWRRKRSI